MYSLFACGYRFSIFRFPDFLQGTINITLNGKMSLKMKARRPSWVGVCGALRLGFGGEERCGQASIPGGVNEFACDLPQAQG